MNFSAAKPATCAPCRERESELAKAITAHLPVLRALARKLCRGHVDADDVVQDAVVRAMQTNTPLRDPRKVRAWLLAIVHKTFLDMLRRRRRRSNVILGIDPPDVAADTPTERLAWEDISDDDVRAAIARLSEDVRTTYQMFSLEGRSYAHIASRLQIPRATVGTRILRARRQLRALLAPRAEKIA
jgi:RNA polymerase sigma-70 factor, ECF subfamily